MISAFLHGLILAFGLILPLGAQNVFVFNQGAFHRRFRQALPTVLTAALCDTLLITLAVLGISLVILGSSWIKTVLLGMGVLFLLYMGWNTWKVTPGADGGLDHPRETFSVRKQIAFAASASLLNPHAIMDTTMVLGTSSLQYAGMEKAAFAVATVLVSWFWFFGLALAGRFLGELDRSGRIMMILQKISALVMWGAAVYLGFSLW
ncbi:amino acid transporter [Thermoactinomyces daqus]|uniref:Amino acid transporter n=1 Tax=Thermoactinomyces daqus TaxID=1329516 RepID=A0A7W2AJT0_9BACL|nr:LysE/ArgO family amino acid transporter [Thermoactinomyces daqus]MBA4544124.1 amino acid transporter [Thermoactinomyces daqus]